MMNDLFHFQIPALDLAIRAVVVYTVVLILLRVSGKKQMGQLGATEFVAILLISNAVQNSMNGGDNSLIGGLLLATVLVVATSITSYLTFRSKFMRQIIEGTPTVMIMNGHLVRKNLKKERLSETEFRGMLRKQGVHKIDEISSAILESDGKLSIFKHDDQPFKTATESME